jgi:hypothetical protein
VSGNPAGQRSLKDRANDLYQVMVVDIRPLTPTDELLLRHAALLMARSERVRSRKSVDACCRMSGEARRLIASLRRRPAESSPPPRSWSEITAKAQEEADVRRARELAEDEADSP